jgi:hypothetical protein
MKKPRTGGDAADPDQITTNNISLQELAAAGPAAIESLGPEPNSPLVRVEIVGHGAPPLTFLLRCGLIAARGES